MADNRCRIPPKFVHCTYVWPNDHLGSPSSYPRTEIKLGNYCSSDSWGPTNLAEQWQNIRCFLCFRQLDCRLLPWYDGNRRIEGPSRPFQLVERRGSMCLLAQWWAKRLRNRTCFFHHVTRSGAICSYIFHKLLSTVNHAILQPGWNLELVYLHFNPKNIYILDGTEPWIVYHAMAVSKSFHQTTILRDLLIRLLDSSKFGWSLITDNNYIFFIQEPDAGWGGRTARTERFSWNPDGSPGFPRPSGFEAALETPSGQ